MCNLKVTVSDSISCKPDTVEIVISISAVDKSVEWLNKYYNSILDNIKKLLEKYDLSESDLVLNRLNFGKKINHVKRESKESLFSTKTSYNDEFAGYTLNTSLTYSTSIDNKNISKLYSSLLNYNKVSCSLTFYCKVLEQYKDELLKLLMSKAKHKADLIAESTGTKVEGVLDIDYSVKNVNVYYNSYENSFDGCCEEDMCCDIESFIDNTEKKGQDISDSITVTFNLI